MLYSRHAGSARAAARSLGASRSDVDDLVAEAFTRVLSALQRGGGPEVAFRPYLMTCVRNAWYDKARKDGRVDVPGEVPEDINLALLNVPPDSEDARMVAAAFASLPERWQMVLWHTEVEGRPAAEVGPLLGLAPNAVAALAYRAREGLRQAYLQAHLQLPPPDACRDTITKLGAYVRDGLSARDRRKVDEHLKHCERCTAVLLELQEVSTSLRGVLLPVLLGVAGTAFLAHARRRRRRACWPSCAGGPAPRRPRPAWWPATAAAVVAGVVGVAAITQHGGERIAAEGAVAPPPTAAVARVDERAGRRRRPRSPPPPIAAAAADAVARRCRWRRLRRPSSAARPPAPPAATSATAPATSPPTLDRHLDPDHDLDVDHATTTTPARRRRPRRPSRRPPTRCRRRRCWCRSASTATPVGPAFAGLSATVNVSTGVSAARRWRAHPSAARSSCRPTRPRRPGR